MKHDKQTKAAKLVQHLPAELIICRYCGEQSSSVASFKGYAHQWGPTTHPFIARSILNNGGKL